jgi:hypothetical protein
VGEISVPQILEFLGYVWSLAALPLTVYLLGLLLVRAGDIVEKQVWNRLRKSGIGDDSCAKYSGNLAVWDRRVNSLFLSGYALVLLSGFLLLGFLGLFFFALMTRSSYMPIIRRPHIRDRMEYCEQMKSLTVNRETD